MLLPCAESQVLSGARGAETAWGSGSAPERQVASSLAARRCHAEPPVAKLVGCSLVTRSSRLGARSSCNFDLQIDFPIDFPLKRWKHFRCFSRVLAELGIPNSQLENDRAQTSDPEDRQPLALCVLSVRWPREVSWVSNLGDVWIRIKPPLPSPSLAPTGP